MCALGSDRQMCYSSSFILNHLAYIFFCCLVLCTKRKLFQKDEKKNSYHVTCQLLITSWCFKRNQSFFPKYILGQKRNAAYKTYIVYGGGGSFINLKQMICHSFSADSWIMSSRGCASYHCHRKKLIRQFKPTFLSILTSRHYAMTS